MNFGALDLPWALTFTKDHHAPNIAQELEINSSILIQYRTSFIIPTKERKASSFKSLTLDHTASSKYPQFEDTITWGMSHQFNYSFSEREETLHNKYAHQL